MRTLLLLVLFVTALTARADNDTASNQEFNPYANSSFYSTTLLPEDGVVYTADYHKYKKRQKVLAICGWTSLGVGVAATTIGYAGWVGSVILGVDSDTAYGAIAITGVCLTAASIPMLVLSAKNKRKAKQCIIAPTEMSTQYLDGSTNRQYGLSLRVNF